MGATNPLKPSATWSHAMTDIPETLLPCPFCGGAAEIERHGTARQSMIAACQHCGARMESGDVSGLTRDLAWNRRAFTTPAAPIERFGLIDEASGHAPLYFGRTTELPPHGISGPEYVKYSDHLSDRAAQAERMARLEEALRNLSNEMRFLLRNHPKMDGGLYRKRLDEAARALSQEGSEPS